jgi:hypothetical protein
MNVTGYRLDNTMKRRVDSRLNITTYGFSRDTKTIVYTSCMQRDQLYRSKCEINMRAASKSTFNNRDSVARHRRAELIILGSLPRRDPARAC